ncbi:MAG: hypothetical protein AAF693_07070 [Bacteroidota bacterium]
MKHDIKKPEVKDVTVAIAKNINEEGNSEWSVHLINNNEVNLENTLVASKGYGEQNGEIQKTSTLRHFLETVEAKTTEQIELIQSDVFHLNNEYWVSYYIDGQIYDKRFTFVPDSITDENLTFIKELNTKGILHS